MSKLDVLVFLCSKILQCIISNDFRFEYNKAKHNNAILIKMKNVVAANDVATKIDLIRNKETEIKKTLMSMNVTVDNEINFNKFKRKQSDR